MSISLSSRTTAILQALIVTAIWSASWVFIKIGLRSGVTPLVFAGMRYFVAFLALLIACLSNPTTRAELRRLRFRQWRLLILLGVLWYALVPGAQFIALSRLPSATLGLILNMTPVLVAIIGTWLLREYLTRAQVVGILLFLFGLMLYFFSAAGISGQVIGLIFATVCLIGNTFATVTARYINRSNTLHPLTVTTGSVGIGSVLLLATGLVVEGAPTLDLTTGGIILWLGVVHTALAYTLWNASLRHLTAAESSLINGLVLVQITLLAWVFLGEAVTGVQIAGLGITLVGVAVVQLRGLPGLIAARLPGIKTRGA